jgi:nitrate reductase NapD
MPDSAGHISSAIVSVRPEHAAAVAAEIARLPDTEVHGVAGGRIIVVMEAADAGDLADRLSAIAALPRVCAASMVFEQAIDPEPMDAA